MDCSASQNTQAQIIDAEERLVIKTRLAAIEVEHNVRVLYACKSASRCQDFASAADGYDVCFLYVHPLSWYLQVNTARDVVEEPISHELTMNDWELRKALGPLKRGDACMIEWLDSPVVYQSQGDFLRTFRKAARQTQQHQRLFHQYVRMARTHYVEHLCSNRVFLKQYYYALRPLLAATWLENKHSMIPLCFTDLIKGTVTEPALSSAIQQWLAHHG
jgi:predicted nucleotidyltransferase